MTKLLCRLPLLLSTVLLGATLAATTGCDNKETVLDVETPDGELEVTRDRDTGEVEVETENN